MLDLGFFVTVPFVALIVNVYVLIAKFAVMVLFLSIVTVAGFVEPLKSPLQLVK